MKEPVTPLVVSFIVSLFFFPCLINYLNKKQATQQIRDCGPQSHKTKKETPAFGGIGVLFSLIIGLFVFLLNLEEIWEGGQSAGLWRLLSLLILVIGTGLVGFIDDWLMFKNKRAVGLKARYKLLGQLIVGLVFLALLLPGNPDGTLINVPDLSQKGQFIPVNFGSWFIPFFLITLLATTNAVNLTDGQDGLAAGTVFISLWYFAGGFIRMLPVEGFVWSLMGSCIGFLWFNAFPAKIFMGDTGSLALGAALTGLAFLSHQPLMLLWIGGVFVIETLSVILQVVYFKLTSGKRIFKMSPLHHHFELSGVHEAQVTIRFWILGLFLTFTGTTFYPVVAW